MKLTDLQETPIRIGAFPDYSAEAVNTILAKLQGADTVEHVEGEFDLVKTGNYYGLKRGNDVVAFAVVGVVEYFDKKYLKLKMIYVMPEERRNKMGHKLLLGISETSDIPVMCDDVISELGFSLFNSYPFNQSLKSLNVRTGEIADFKDGDEMMPKIALILENKTFGLWRQFLLPLSEHKDYLKFSFGECIK